jgi:hypothetical protein
MTFIFQLNGQDWSARKMTGGVNSNQHQLQGSITHLLYDASTVLLTFLKLPIPFRSYERYDYFVLYR